MSRTTHIRPLLIDPAAPRRTARERAAMRWFTRDAPDGTSTLVWGTVSDTTPAVRLAAAA
jgi:hypothetical protein